MVQCSTHLPMRKPSILNVVYIIPGVYLDALLLHTVVVNHEQRGSPHTMIPLLTSNSVSSEDSYCSGQNSSTSSLTSVCNHTTEVLSSRSIIAEEVSLFRDTETLVAPTRYAAVASEEEHTSLRGDHSSQLSGDSAHFRVAAGKVRQSKPTRVVHTETQETGYCTATATQGEIPVLGYDGKIATYRKPCESETHLGQHGAIGTLTTTDRVARDEAAPMDDNKTSGVTAEGTGSHKAGHLFSNQSQSLTPQHSSSSSNSTLLFHTDAPVPLDCLGDSAPGKAGVTPPGDSSFLSHEKQERGAATSHFDRAVGGVVLPDAPGGGTESINSSTQDWRLARGPQVVDDSLVSRVPGPQLVTSVQATDDVDMPHPTDLVVAVAKLPRSMARSMAVNVHRYVCRCVCVCVFVTCFALHVCT